MIHLSKLGGILLFALLFVELPFIAFLYDPQNFKVNDTLWFEVNTHLRQIVPFVLFFFVTLTLIFWPERKEIYQTWKNSSEQHLASTWIGINLTLFVTLVFTTIYFNKSYINSSEAPWLIFVIWGLSIGLMILVLLLAIAPFEFWKKFLQFGWKNILLTFIATSFIVISTLVSQTYWDNLSAVTLDLSYWFLQKFESDVVIDRENFILGTKDFIVHVGSACSGYEGIGLVTTFLGLYLWLFRASLKFPNVFLLFPIGIAAIWILNALRIALLISLGTNYSKAVAVGGFHSQAGWMMFLAITVLIMVASHHISFFRSHPRSNSVPTSRERYAIVCLSPFIALMLSHVILEMFSGEGYWLYGLTVLSVSGVLLSFRNDYIKVFDRFTLLPVLVGSALGLLWVLTESARGTQSDLSQWLSSLDPEMARFWIAMRMFGLVLLVPIAEELVFRGYLHRILTEPRFDYFSSQHIPWLAFAVTSLAFGLMHDRWIAGALSGAVFAILMYRSGKLADPIAAHISANAIIALWVLMNDDWGML